MAEQLSLLEILERPTLEALFKPDVLFENDETDFLKSLPEDTRFERKSNRASGATLASLLSAFGNGPAVEGGVVAVGMDDTGQIEGCKSLGADRLSEIEAAGRDRCPDGRFKVRRVPAQNGKGEEDFIVLLRMYFVESRLVECTDGNAYCREGSTTRRLPIHESAHEVASTQSASRRASGGMGTIANAAATSSITASLPKIFTLRREIRPWGAAAGLLKAQSPIH